MSTIDVGIGHNNNLIITKFCDIKIITITFRKATAKSIDHSFDLCICKNFIDTCLFYVQNLTTNRQNRLKASITGSFCTTTRRITLYDKDFTFTVILGLAVSQFTIRIKGKLLFC